LRHHVEAQRKSRADYTARRIHGLLENPVPKSRQLPLCRQ
jgi:hypothetical protein